MEYSPLQKLHSIASYPKDIHGIVIREQNFCIQFEDVKSTLRVNLLNPKEGTKKTPEGLVSLPVTTTGTQIYLSGMRLPIPKVLKLQEELIKGYRKYYQQNNTYYTVTYGESFLNVLLRHRAELNRVISIAERYEAEMELFGSANPIL